MTQVSTGETEVVAKKPETVNEHEKTREKKERVRPPTKVVIRRLPPSLTKEAFINQISPLAEHDYLYFVRPDKSLGPFGFSRAYINFIKQEDIFTFKEQFDNYTFMDKKGNEYQAVVEFAPFQRLPKKRMGRKRDPKMGLLEQDPAYMTYLENRTAKSGESGSTQHCPLEYFPPPEKKKITTTPLLDFLRQRRAERQRMRDERREERRRKEQERKRLKDADRDRRRGTGKPDTGFSRDTASDSVLKFSPQEVHQALDWDTKNTNKNYRQLSVDQKTEPRHKKWNDATRLCSPEQEDNIGEDKLFKIVDSLESLTLDVTSPKDTDSKSGKINESQMCYQNETDNGLHGRNINVETDLPKESNTFPKESIAGENVKNTICKKKIPMFVQNRNVEQGYKLGRRTVCLRDFIFPVLEANRDRLRQIEGVRKLPALRHEVPQPRVIKIVSLDCEVVKSKDYELKLLVRHLAQEETHKSCSSSNSQITEYNDKKNRSGNAATGFGLKKYTEDCQKTVFEIEPREVDEIINKSCVGYCQKNEKGQAIYKSGRGKSVESRKNNLDVYVRSYSCPIIASSCGNIVQKDIVKICNRNNCSCKMQFVTSSHDRRQVDCNFEKSYKNYSFNRDKDFYSRNSVHGNSAVSCESEDFSNIALKPSSRKSYNYCNVLENSCRSSSSWNNQQKGQNSASTYKHVGSLNSREFVDNIQIKENSKVLDGFKKHSQCISFPTNTQKNCKLQENVVNLEETKNALSKQLKTEPSPVSTKTVSLNRKTLNYSKEKEIETVDPTTDFDDTSKWTPIQEMWKIKRESDINWPVPFIPRCPTKQDSSRIKESQSYSPRSVHIIQDARTTGFLPAFKSKPKTSQTTDESCTNQNTSKDSSSVFQDVLRNPEHEKEAKDDSNRGGGSKESRDKMQQQGTKKREEERQRNNRDKERERKERQLQENRQRETKGQGSVKSYRDDRQKQMEIRAQRKLPEDQRRKTSYERNQGHVKTSENRQGHESEKGVSKTSDTRRSQEFDRGSSKLSDTRRSQEFERNQGSSKIIDSRKNQEYDRQTHSNRDMDHRKHYQSGDQRKAPSERFQGHAKDGDKQSKENEHRKIYKDSESKRGYKDVDQKRNSYNVKSPRSYNEVDSKKNSDHRIHFKEGDQKQSKEPQEESVKTEKQDESKKWEQMGAKPKRKLSHDVKSDTKGDRTKEQAVKTDKSANKFPNRRNSLESADDKCDRGNNLEDDRQESVEKEPTFDFEEKAKRRNSLELENHKLNFHDENVSKDMSYSSDPEKQDTNEPQDKPMAEVRDIDNLKSFFDYKYGAKPSKRRGSLDSGDHDSEVQGMSRSATGSDWSMDSKLKRNHSLDLDGHRWYIDGGHGDGMMRGSDRSSGEMKKDDKDMAMDVSGNGVDGENKRDPRVERRIRNKDRPSIEIYRPGMGRFSLQRKEREKGPGSAPGTAGSSMEQESPSSSPSPTPTNTSRPSTSNKSPKSGTELRSMTFKRSVSREK